MNNDQVFRAILLFGMPGCGKGTQGKALGTLPGFLHLACGDVFRQMDPTTEPGRTIAQITSQGRLVSDEQTVELWRSHLARLEQRGEFNRRADVVILDGIPRTYRQAELLSADLVVTLVVNLVMQNPDEAIERIRRRALKENRRDDADEVVIRRRLETFRTETEDTLRYYDPRVVVAVNASRRPIEVLHEVVGHICRSSAVPASGS